jgi:uncharacterized protein YabE (DUF348 family)
MTIQEPPLLPDDTQPTRSSSRDTLVPIWLLVALIVFSSISLIATFVWALSSTAPPGNETLAIQDVILLLEGERRDIQTSLTTVEALLLEQGIGLGADDAISPALDTPLSDGLVITIARARSVLLVVDGETLTVHTPFDTPADILIQAQIKLRPIDHVWVDGTLAGIGELMIWPVPANEIIVQHAFQITVRDGVTETLFETTADTIGDALYEAGIIVYFSDSVTPEQGQALTEDTIITIDRARPVVIQVDGVRLETRVSGTTVADALTEAGIALLGLDYTIPAETEAIEGGMSISVLRVTESIESYEEPIAYETVYQANEQLELDQRQIIQAGETGLQGYHERVRFENGIEVGREPAGSEMIRAPKNEIIAYGTNIVIRSINTSEGTKDYWRVLRMYATSYHPEALGGDNITAIGETLRRGIVASDPNLIAYRSTIYVESYGPGMMADTGGARSSPYWIDLGYSDEDYVSWHRYVDVYLLTPVPANIDYLLPTWRSMRGLPDN